MQLVQADVLRPSEEYWSNFVSRPILSRTDALLNLP